MKTVTLCIVVTLALAVLIGAILLQKPKKKEGFQGNVKEVGLGIAIAIVILLVVFAGFFLFYYSVPKQPNNIVNRAAYYFNAN